MKPISSLATLTAATLALFLWQPRNPQVSVAQVIPQQETTQATVDRRVEAALDSLGLNYEVMDSGTIRVAMRFDSDRTQTAYITSSTRTIGDMEIRTIASAAYITDGPLSSELANKLLLDNANRKLGAWQMVELDDQQNLTLFLAQIEANSRPEQLGSALYAVLYTADEMEAEITGSDRF